MKRLSLILFLSTAILSCSDDSQSHKDDPPRDKLECCQKQIPFNFELPKNTSGKEEGVEIKGPAYIIGCHRSVTVKGFCKSDPRPRIGLGEGTAFSPYFQYAVPAGSTYTVYGGDAFTFVWGYYLQ